MLNLSEITRTDCGLIDDCFVTRFSGPGLNHEVRVGVELIKAHGPQARLREENIALRALGVHVPGPDPVVWPWAP